jgi:hypothetical protein
MVPERRTSTVNEDEPVGTGCAPSTVRRVSGALDARIRVGFTLTDFVWPEQEDEIWRPYRQLWQSNAGRRS